MAKASRGLDFALQAGQGIVGAGMGLLLQGGQDRRQIEMQKKLQSLEISGQKEMTDYNMMKQLEMWKATNYGAQMEQLKAAGLNPGLIYGMGGAGGATTGQAAGNVTGGHAPTGGGEALAMMQNATQLGLLRAQKENIEADTANKKAEIPVKGAEVPLKEAQTQSLLQGIQNQKAEKLLIQAQTELVGSQDSQVKRQEQELWRTQEDRVTIYANEAKKTIEEAKQALIQTGLDQRTVDDKAKILAGQAVGVIIQNELMRAQTAEAGSRIELNQEQASAIGVQLMQKWGELSLEQRKTLIIERVGKFHSAQSQRTYDNILKGAQTVFGSVTPAGKMIPPASRNPIGFQY